jgi:hypothetical protein
MSFGLAGMLESDTRGTIPLLSVLLMKKKPQALDGQNPSRNRSGGATGFRWADELARPCYSNTQMTKVCWLLETGFTFYFLPTCACFRPPRRVLFPVAFACMLGYFTRVEGVNMRGYSTGPRSIYNEPHSRCIWHRKTLFLASLLVLVPLPVNCLFYCFLVVVNIENKSLVVDGAECKILVYLPDFNDRMFWRSCLYCGENML